MAIVEPELVTPVDRITVGDLPVYDYRLYPAVESLADKVCGVMERHHGIASSRVKDLVDIVVLATVVDIDACSLKNAICRESALRGLCIASSFELPGEWGAMHAKQYAKLAAQAHLPEHVRDMRGGVMLAKALIDPVLGDGTREGHWNHEKGEWAFE